MYRKNLTVNLVRILAIAALLAAGAGLLLGRWAAPAAGLAGEEPAAPAAGGVVYLPKLFNSTPTDFRFGVEVTGAILPGSNTLARLLELNPGLVRLGGAVRWHLLQPEEGKPIDWGQLALFETSLRTLRQAGIPALVAITGTPDWAVLPDARDDNILTSCGPVRPDKMAAFASFVSQVAARYSAPEYGVHQWEIGNEPDFDPDSVEIDSPFGCWGDRDDLVYFGGQRYGEMLKVIAPAIRAADPDAVVWLGGLVLSSPNTNPLDGHGIPELFLRGVLQSGAAPHFDAIGYHWHTSYWDATVDYDLVPEAWGSPWTALGGGVVGKSSFLQGILDDYGVSKPLYLNETAIGCLPTSSWCLPTPDSNYYANQAYYVARTMVRGLGHGVAGQVWYSLEDPGWRYTGLLNFDGTPRPAFTAYQFISAQLGSAVFVSPVDYGAGIEAYRFQKNGRYIDVLWALENQALTVPLPGAKLLGVYDYLGSLLPVEATQSEMLVGFEPVYLVRNP